MSIPVVYDTMLFLQAASRPDRTHGTFQAIQDKRVSLLLSAELLAEIHDVLTRKNIRAKFPALTPDVVRIFIDNVLAHSTLVDPVPHVFDWPEHPDDNHLFDLAIHAKVSYLATWETRILNLATEDTPPADHLRKMAPDLAIVTPSRFAELVRVTR